MPALTPPVSDRRAIRTLASASDEAFQVFVSVIKSSPVTTDLGNMAQSLASTFPSLEAEALKEMIDLVISMGAARTSQNMAVDEFVESVIDGMARVETEPLSSDELVRVRTRLPSILGLETGLGAAAKVLNVVTDHERVFCSARVLTDIRPVFGENIDEDPEQFVPIHHLKIVYHHGGQHGEFFVTLDSSDIRTLRNILDRADAKLATIKGILERSKLDVLDLD